MAARLSPVEFYEREVRPRLQVRDVYGAVRFTETRGRYWRGPCPLHGGTAPNFSVDTETLGWTCFSGCQRSGSALAFVNGGDHPRGADFVALVRSLAAQVGVDTTALDRPQTPEEAARAEHAARRGTLWETVLGLTRAALHTPDGREARTYLAGRGFPEETLRDTEFGVYVDPQTVLRALTGKGFTREDLETAGLLDSRWTRRLVFPWRDRTGQVGGFAARDLTGTGDPKYLYSTGTPKAELVAFGLDVALRKGRTDLLLVEGLLDVVLLQSRGRLDVAAIGGPGGEFSPSRWAALAGAGVRSVTLVLDNDETGRTGTRKALDNLSNAPLAPKVSVVDPALLAPAKDPDEYVRTRGVEAFAGLLAQAVPWAIYEARTLLAGVDPQASPLARQTATEAVLDFVAGLHHETAVFDRADILRDVADRTGYGLSDLTALEEDRRRVRREQDAVRQLSVALREAQIAHTQGTSAASVTRTLRETVARVEALTVPPPPGFNVDRLLEVSTVAREGRPSGWEALDRSDLEKGLGLRFHAGELALFAARTGHGKTSVLVGLLRHWIQTTPEDELVAFYSLEEPEVRIFHRLVALETCDLGAPWTANEVRDFLRNPTGSPTNGRDWPDVGALDDAVRRVRQYQDRVIVVNEPRWTVAALDAHARSLGADRVSAVLVDYLQRLPGDGTFDRRDLEVSAVARRLKALAVDLNVPVVAGAQINREALKNKDVPRGDYTSPEVQRAIKDRRPKLEHLREGGSEQEADLVLGLLNYRADFEEDGDKSVPSVTDFEIGILKNRYGAPGRWAALRFEGRYHVLRDR